LKITFICPAFERHAQAHPELRAFVPANEYIGPPSPGIAAVAAATPEGHQVEFLDDRITPFDLEHEADLYAISSFTPAATRAFELGDALRARGKKVVLGGIFPSMMPDLAAEHCDAVVVGEGEGVWPQIVADAQKGKLAPRYQSQEPLDLATIKRPRVELYLDAEKPGAPCDDYPLQLSRGCPLSCDACVLPIMCGSRIRFHSEQNVIDTMTVFARAGKLLSLTEDTSVFGIHGARKMLRKFLERTIELQKQGIPIKLSYLGISMPMVLSLDPTLLTLMRQSGMDRFYLVGGFDPITRQAFGTGDPAAMEKAERTIARCRELGIDPYVSFLVGNADDDEGVFDRMLEFCTRTGVDLAEFAISTPYPGTPIWKRYEAEGRIFDRTWKHYNDANVVFKPHKMSALRLQEGYIYLWREFYQGRQELRTREHTRGTIQF